MPITSFPLRAVSRSTAVTLAETCCLLRYPSFFPQPLADMLGSLPRNPENRSPAHQNPDMVNPRDAPTTLLPSPPPPVLCFGCLRKPLRPSQGNAKLAFTISNSLRRLLEEPRYKETNHEKQRKFTSKWEKICLIRARDLKC